MTAAALQLAILLGAALAVAAQSPDVRTPEPSSFFWPDAVYDPAIPPMRDLLGHDPGERIVSPEEALRYLEALQAAAPGRLRIVEYGRTWENRPLVYAVVGSERNLARLDAIRAGMQRLADPRRTAAGEAEALFRDLPAVVWLAYGVHGDEISSTDAALHAAYHLLAARGDELVEAAFENALVILDPSQNPDGRARFVHHQRGTLGLAPSPHPLAAERDQPWPGGRTNHYLFDLNRDWFALTQPETRARVRAVLEWYPLVHVDVHEMGAESTYFFPPTAEPLNPHLPSGHEEAFELFGRNNARWFDRFGFDYYTREIFDFFYPGYGDSWPALHGAIGMTYEQASARGLIVRRPDGSLLTYREGVRRHFVATISTIETAARNRERLLRDFWRFRSSAIEEGRRAPAREHVLPWRGDTSLVEELAGLLVEQGVEVRRSTQPVAACRERFPAGSYFVSSAQPAGHLARTLLERQVDMAPPFLREQERRRRKALPHEMYDVTGWSLPLLYGVEHVPCGEEVSTGALELVEREEGGWRARSRPVVEATVSRAVAIARGAGGETSGAAAGTAVGAAGESRRPIAGDRDALAYLVPWGTAASGRFLVAALERGLEVLGADGGFTIDGRSFPRGTLIVKGRDDSGALGTTLAELATATGAEVVATRTSWVDEGINFGSDRVVRLRRPEVALAWNEPTVSYAAGAARWVLEQRLGLAVTPVRTARLASADLHDFDVVILPDGSGFADVLDESGAQNLRRFVEGGGVLIAIAGAVSYFADPDVGLLSVREETRALEQGGDGASSPERDAAPTVAGGESAGSSGAAAGGDGGGGSDESAGPVAGTVLSSEAEYLAAIAAEEPPPDTVPGALARAVPDPDHWLTVGLPSAIHVMVQGSSIFTPIRLDRGTNVLRFAPADELVASGYLWEENRRQLAWKPVTVIEPLGRGFVIGFTADPTLRGFLAGCDLLLLNAVVRAPAHVSQ
ncbi:MAG TPA: M14 family metallopeptidase [Thermoanaerobaculia bacterium]|nr:M14 family metallopeptidase [Thermoanaerobaculia bacterium]